MGPGKKLVGHMQNLLYTYDEYLMICIGQGPSISSVICKNSSYSGPSYPSSPVPYGVCEKGATDLKLVSGFHWLLRFPFPLTSNTRFGLNMEEKVKKKQIPEVVELDSAYGKIKIATKRFTFYALANTCKFKYRNKYNKFKIPIK